VQNDVGFVGIVEVTAPSTRLILSIDLSGFSVGTDLFLEFGDFLLPRFNLLDSLRDFEEIVRRRRLFLQFVVTVNPDFFEIDKRSGGFFEVKNLRPLSVARTLALGDFCLNINFSYIV